MVLSFEESIEFERTKNALKTEIEELTHKNKMERLNKILEIVKAGGKETMKLIEEE